MGMNYTIFDTPIGPLTLVADSDGVLHRLAFGTPAVPSDWQEDDGPFDEVREQLNQYFSGQRQEFDLPFELEGTEWQLRVWAELQRIPYGETRSYREVAALACERTGWHAARAVGSANHCNPIPIIVPCHRVIGADGKLVGFGGGLETKRSLLDLEAGRLALI
jgi:methylated-DNA-[protein]-cysteine S-methyltransferase